MIIYERFANDLSSETSEGKGDADKRKSNIRTLLNFFPVIGEDEEGEMVELDAEKVLSIPRKIKSQEVVKRGFNITEIVKRLYQSEAMKKLYPKDGERLRHIFEKQVYGLAPTEIIYRIAIRYSLYSRICGGRAHQGA